MSTFVIFNPKARLGEASRRKAELIAALERHVGPHVFLETTHARHAEQLAKHALSEGATRLVVAGGDGTVSEVITGLIAHERGSAVSVVPLPMGTGRDFARLLGLGTDIETAVSRIQTGRTQRVDVARVTCLDAQGQVNTRAFLNITSFGLTGEAALWLEDQAQRGRRNKLSYTLAGFVGFRNYRPATLTVKVDDQPVFQGRLALGVAANGQYFAGGMRVAPNACVNDGELDFVLIPTRSFLGSLLMFPRLIRGTHVRDSRVISLRGRKLEATTTGVVRIEADGEPVGVLPLKVEVIAGALTLAGLSP